MHELDICLSCPEGNELIYRSLSVESDGFANIIKEPGGIRIIMKAESASRLRAIMNSYMKWIIAIQEITKVI